jgi:hypothetical protein
MNMGLMQCKWSKIPTTGVVLALQFLTNSVSQGGTICIRVHRAGRRPEKAAL